MKEAGSSSERVRAALSRPEFYPDRPEEVELRETHISWVFLAGELAYKLKKPLVLDFIDYGTPERRRAMCEEEVRLNRRLAPNLYLGVRGVALTDGGAELTRADDPRGSRTRARGAAHRPPCGGDRRRRDRVARPPTFEFRGQWSVVLRNHGSGPRG